MKLWEKQEWQEKLKALHAQRWNDGAIGEVLGCHPSTVGKARQALGLSANPRCVLGPNLEALYTEARPGCCVACDGRLKGMRRVLCGRHVCALAWHRAYGLDRRMRESAQRRAA